MYYDPQKEQLAERQRSMEGAEDEDALKYRLRQGFKRHYNEESAMARRQATIRSNVRLVMIILVLLLGAYVLLVGNMDSLIKLIGS